jgi:hypothetical protein
MFLSYCLFHRVRSTLSKLENQAARRGATNTVTSLAQTTRLDMAQVDSKNITAAPADPTRRRFLSQAAGVAAGGTVLALASLPASAAADPVFALIEAHRAAAAALTITLREVDGHDNDDGRPDDHSGRHCLNEVH